MVLESRAFLVGTPTLNNNMFPTVGEFLTYIKGLAAAQDASPGPTAPAGGPAER